MNDTTKKGVSDDNEETGIDKLNANKPGLERDDDINQIAANARKAREAERDEMDIPGDIKRNLESSEGYNEDDDDDNPADKNKPEPDKLELEKQEAKKPAEDEKPERVLVKINGVEKMVPKADVDAEGGVVAYQKARSADEKMRQAAEQRKANEAKERELAERELAFSRQEEAQLNKDENSSAESSKDARSISERAKALKDKLYSGDEAKVAEAVQEILDARDEGATHPDMEKLASDITAKVQLEYDRKQAVADFKTEYSEIDSNPEYRNYADQATLAIRKEHPDWTPKQIIMEAGEQARLKFADQIREKSAAAEDQERMSNKRATDNVRGADASPSAKPAPKAKTQSEVIAEMMASRSHAN